MSANFYVLRHRCEANGAHWGWTGPIKGGLSQARREVAAWADAGWDASVMAPTREVRAEVRRWERLTIKGGYRPDFEAMGRTDPTYVATGLL